MNMYRGDFMKKGLDKKYILLSVFLILCSVLIPLFLEKFYFLDKFNFVRLLIIIIVLLFLSLHYIFGYRRLWDYTFRYRYLIGVLLFTFLVAFGINGSSVSIYNGAIQGDVILEDGNPIFGAARTIRGDEWAVSTPIMLSQDLEINNYGDINYSLMASEFNTTFYMGMPNWSLSTLTNPARIGFLFLPRDNAFSFYWYFYQFLLFFASFELIMILTKNKKLLSFFGAVLITFSPATQWWSSYQIIAFGELAMIFLYHFLKNDNWKKKFLYAIGIGYSGACYIMSMYPAWIVTYAYFFLAIVIWMIYTFKHKNKFKDYLLLFGTAILTILTLILPSFIQGYDSFQLVTSTAYPGARSELGGYGFSKMFRYGTNFLTAIREPNNACEMAQFICLYPLPMILGVIQIFSNFKKKKKDLLLILLLTVSIFLNIWNFVQLPEWLAKITLLSLSTVDRASVVLGFVNTILIIKLISDYQEEGETSLVKKISCIVLSVVYSIVTVYFCYQMYPEYMTIKKILFCGAIIIVLSYLFMRNNKKTNLIFEGLMICITFFSGVIVNPVNIGLSSLYEKPVAKEIQQITNNDPWAKWITIDSPYYLSNYALANGARMLNSTNYYPNWDLWTMIDPNKEFEEVYNRYAHINVSLVDGESSCTLINMDSISLNLSYSLLDDLDIKYILSSKALESVQSGNITFKQIYNESGMYIYQVIY